MRSQTLLGAALATAMAGALALSIQAPSSAVPEDAGTAAGTGRAGGHRPRPASTLPTTTSTTTRSAFTKSPRDTFQRVDTSAGTEAPTTSPTSAPTAGSPSTAATSCWPSTTPARSTGSANNQEQVIDIANLKADRERCRRARRPPGAGRPRRPGRAAPTLAVLRRGRPAARVGRPTSTGTNHGTPSDQTVYIDAHTGKVARLPRTRSARAPATATTTPASPSAPPAPARRARWSTPPAPASQCGGQNGAAYTGTDDVWGNGSGTNLETACVDVLYGTDKEVDMLSAWLGRSGIKGNGTTYPARVGLADVNAFYNGSYVNFGHSQRQRPPAHRDRHRRARAGPRRLPDHAGRLERRQRDRRHQRGHRRHLRRAHRGVRQQPQRPGRLPGRRGGRPGRRRPDPQHVQPVRARRPELLLLEHPEDRGARGRRPAEPLVLPAPQGSQRLAGLPDLQRVDGHRRRHPDRGQDLLQRPAAEDVELDARQGPGRDPDRGAEPLRHHGLHDVQPGQGRLGRGLGAGPVGRADLRPPPPAGGACTEVTTTGQRLDRRLGVQAVVDRVHHAPVA